MRMRRIALRLAAKRQALPEPDLAAHTIGANF